MPVQLVDEDALLVSKFERLSATSLIQHRACPRSWWHRRVEYLRGPQVPAMLRGHIVENTVCRVLRESPSLVSADAAWDLLSSPLDADGRPDRFNPDRFPGPDIEAIPGSEDFEGLRAWARARASVHLPEVRAAHVEGFEDDPMSLGDANELDDDRMLEMVHNTLDMHLAEVERCFAAAGGPGLADWRTGQRPEWPAPDGFAHDWSQPHPAAFTGDCTLLEAWEVARPWFVDPDAATFSLGAVHPEHWFWGEYDFVYRWNGEVSIVDLKAAMGDNDRSAGYVTQLEIYAWLWWETHGRRERVTDLRLWYAGANVEKGIDAPSETRLQELADELRAAYDLLFVNRSEDIEDFPMKPSPMRIFEAGGKEVGVEEDPLARCRTCDHRSICPNGDDRGDLPGMASLQHAGRNWPITSATEIATRATLCGEVTGLQSPRREEDGGIVLKFNLQQGVDRLEVRNTFLNKPRQITRRIANGSHVRIVDGRPTEWNLTPALEVDDHSRIEIIDASEADGDEIVGLTTAASVVGRVMTIRDTTWHKNRTGSGKPKWRLTIQDATGRIDVVAYGFVVPTSAPSVRPGDDIAILNGVLSEFFGRPEIKFQKGTRLAILRRGSD